MTKVMLVFDEPPSCAKCPLSYIDNYYSDDKVSHCIMESDGDMDNQEICRKYKDSRAPFCMLQPAPEWIKCEDALPGVGECVLVVYNNSDTDVGKLYNSPVRGLRWDLNDAMYSLKEITHWMPFPRPPKNAKEGSVE